MTVNRFIFRDNPEIFITMSERTIVLIYLVPSLFNRNYGQHRAISEKYAVFKIDRWIESIIGH